jgi:hypothetical protein
VLKDVTPSELVVKVSEATMAMELSGGCLIECKSADDPAKLRGVGLDVAVLSEAGLLSPDVWNSSIRPRLSSPGRLGCAIITGTPRGKGWLYKAFLDGQDPEKPEWWSLQAPTSANPLIPAAEIEDARRDLPDRAFREQYLGEFLDDGGEVFRGIRDLVVPPRERIGSTVIGIDFGFTQDFTVLSALDESHYLCGFSRFNNVGWATTLDRIIQFVDEFSPVAKLVPEGTRSDSQIVEQLRTELAKRGVTSRVEPFITTPASKRNLIEKLAFAIERRRISYPDIPVLLDELSLFEFTQTADGPRYSAPRGCHDDCVVSLALGYHGLEVTEQSQPSRTAGFILDDTPVQTAVGQWMPPDYFSRWQR